MILVFIQYFVYDIRISIWMEMKHFSAKQNIPHHVYNSEEKYKFPHTETLQRTLENQS